MRCKQYIYKKSTWLIGLCLMGLALNFSSCQKKDNILDLDINVDPNNPTQGSVELLLPQTQIDLAALMQGLNDPQMGFVGVLSSFDSYGLGANSFNGTWSFFFTGPGKDIEDIISVAKATNNRPYLGVAQVMKAYAFSTMVDLFGTLPYTEAFAGNSETANVNAKFDEGKAIYDSCYKLLDSAVANLNASSTITIKNDIFYSGSKTAWVRLANTVRLRMLMTSRKVNPNASTQIQAALTAPGGIISSPTQDLSYKYGGQISPQDLRHPWFTAAYLANNNFTYILTQYMFDMLVRKDPRLPFYFRRQYDKILDQTDPTDRGATPVAGGYLVLNPVSWSKGIAAGVLANTKEDSAYLAGYFGRVRGDQSGVPDDVRYRMVPGVYPAAGLYDNRSIAPFVLNSKTNTGGAGILPLITSNMVKFWTAEAQLAYGFGTPRATAEAAIRESIATVTAFGVSKDPLSIVPTASAVDAYVNAFLADYDASATSQVKMNKVLYEAWFAGWGNGFEMYNAFRRTGYPSNIVPPVTIYNNFALRVPIPAVEASLNSNAPSPLPIWHSSTIFWDDVKFQF